MSDSAQVLEPLVTKDVNRKRRPLRVCHLAYTFYENDNRVMRYAEMLAGQGDEVEVIALRRLKQSRGGYLRGVRLTRIQRRDVKETRAWTYLINVLLFLTQSFTLLTFRHIRKRYDIIHIHNIPDFLVFAAAVPKLMGARIILDIHDVLPELYASKFRTTHSSPFFRLLLLIERACCCFADHVIIANDLWRQKVVQRAISADRCTAILNYPDLRLFRPLSIERKRTDNKFIILYPGSLNRHQGVDIAVRAFSLVQDRLPRAEFHIYGEGPARSELVTLVADCRLVGRVKLMAPLPLDEIAKVMASADLGVEPKRGVGFSNEALSTKILEFMACRVPVVAARTRVHAHYFDDTLVRFFPPGDEAALAQLLIHFYNHRQEYGDWILRAEAFAGGFSWQERAVDYRYIIDSIINPPSDQLPTVASAH